MAKDTKPKSKESNGAAFRALRAKERELLKQLETAKRAQEDLVAKVAPAAQLLKALESKDPGQMAKAFEGLGFKFDGSKVVKAEGDPRVDQLLKDKQTTEQKAKLDKAYGQIRDALKDHPVAKLEGFEAMVLRMAQESYDPRTKKVPSFKALADKALDQHKETAKALGLLPEAEAEEPEVDEDEADEAPPAAEEDYAGLGPYERARAKALAAAAKDGLVDEKTPRPQPKAKPKAAEPKAAKAPAAPEAPAAAEDPFARARRVALASINAAE